MIKVEWQQMPTPTHPAGMRLECSGCDWVAYFGDSALGDKEMAEAKVAHQCN